MKDQNTPTNTLEEVLERVFRTGYNNGSWNARRKPENWLSLTWSPEELKAIEQYVSQAVNKALLKQARRVTQGGHGGTEIFIENTPISSVIRQLEAELNKTNTHMEGE